MSSFLLIINFQKSVVSENHGSPVIAMNKNREGLIAMTDLLKYLHASEREVMRQTVDAIHAENNAQLIYLTGWLHAIAEIKDQLKEGAIDGDFTELN